MTHVSWRSVGLITLLIACIASTPLAAEPPTIETLVAGLPFLSPNNERLDRFQFTFETPLPFEVPIVTTLVWERPDKYGMIVVVGEERTPVWFLSQTKSMMFDVTTGTADLSEHAGPKFNFKVDAATSSIKYECALTGQKNAEVIIDLPSFVREATKNGKLVADSAGDWRVTTVSESGESKVITTFQNSKGFPIRHLEVRSTTDDSLVFAIRDIAVNAEANIAWTDFPNTESFPTGLRLIEPGDRHVEAMKDGVDVAARIIRTVAAQGALRNAKWRELPYLVNVDWARAQETNAAFGPPLRKLLNGTD